MELAAVLIVLAMGIILERSARADARVGASTGAPAEGPSDAAVTGDRH